MGLVRQLAIGVLLITILVFSAFFGRLPALRNTPVGTCYRIIWIHIPNGFGRVDQLLTGGRISLWTSKVAHHLWNDRHPLVMIFFILLLSVCEILFLPPAWKLLSNTRKIIGAILVILPYVLLYASAASDPGYLTPLNHSHEMSLYPYDFTIFDPGNTCHTCRLLKPARSKHCSICKHCISRMDHHCIFINNCVGYNNIHWFLLLLFFTATLISYATYVGFSLLDAEILANLSSWTIYGKGFTWSEYFTIWAWALQEYTRIGIVTLMCFLTGPLIWILFGYHIYLIWAGTTTNESMKWSDLNDDMADGFAFKRSIHMARQKDPCVESMHTTWPAESQQIVVRTRDGLPPKTSKQLVGNGEWERVWRLADVENLYDLGFWDNLKDVFWNRR
ncbi:hypothetical protein HYFRA_00002387 [Hymenoscyphus fraxineus]|uniref:Palmitoyltransferase n=1 Tax=Hymenoscyphus fraxineus TaxID=746836 RepID=A0A9N9L5R1_9HELO|nr:hypothetical protein HYFRA_00002387 [Hymenoscyphus fraxineus]